MTETVVYRAKTLQAMTAPTPMKFQIRDGDILDLMDEWYGIMTQRHLHRLFWPGKSLRALEKRMAKLVNAGYVNRPTREQWRTQAIPEPFYWLSWKGILWVAAHRGIVVKPPTGTNENQLRQLEKRLKDQGMYWVREPRWSQLAHDFAVNDFRLAVVQLVERLPALRIEAWLHEGSFRSQPDVVEFTLKQARDESTKQKKAVFPDSYFVIVDEQRHSGGAPARARFLLEIDRATHDNSSFGREKVLPGIAYLLSPAYKEKFGDNSGRWLVVTTGERRLMNLKRQAETVAGLQAAAFFFTTFEQVTADTVLTAPIWYQGGKTEPQPLFTGRGGPAEAF